MLRGQTKADSTGGEILQRTPHARHYQQSLPRVIQHNLTALLAVIQHHPERAADSYEQLSQLLMSVTATALSAGHIINPIGTAYVKRHIPPLLRNSQGATRSIQDAGQRHYLAII